MGRVDQDQDEGGDGQSGSEENSLSPQEARRRKLEAEVIAGVIAANARFKAEDALAAAEEAERLSRIPPPPAPVALRDEMFQARGVPCPTLSRPLPELEIVREEASPADAETQVLLNSIIGELHFLMKEVVFRSICQSAHVEDRLSFLNASMRLAETGAQVGDSVAKLRSGSTVQETRQRHIMEYVKRMVGEGDTASL